MCGLVQVNKRRQTEEKEEKKELKHDEGEDAGNRKEEVIEKKSSYKKPCIL